VLNPILYRNIPFEFTRDFSVAALIGSFANMLLVYPSVPANSVKELIALAKSKPGQLSYGSAGIGSPIHHPDELFKARAGVEILRVPYKGGGPAVLDSRRIPNCSPQCCISFIGSSPGSCSSKQGASKVALTEAR